MGNMYICKKKKEKQKNQDRATMDKKKKENLTTHKTCIHLYFQDD